MVVGMQIVSIKVFPKRVKCCFYTSLGSKLLQCLSCFLSAPTSTVTVGRPPKVSDYRNYGTAPNYGRKHRTIFSPQTTALLHNASHSTHERYLI